MLVMLAAFAFAAPAAAQNVKNPTLVEFTSVDHDNPELTGYELDILRSDNTVLQTLSVPKSSTTKNASTQVVSFTINVQPIAFGTYVGTVRAVAGAIKSDSSTPSNAFDRSPGAPSKPAIK
jgi:hypothetical protein